MDNFDYLNFRDKIRLTIEKLKQQKILQGTYLLKS